VSLQPERQTVKQVIQNYRSGKLEVAEIPVPELRPGTVLVRTAVSLISAGTERQLMGLAKASLIGKAVARPDLVRQVVRKVERDGIVETIGAVFAKLDTPIPLGYSLAGVVVDVHPAITHLAAGDRIACAGAGYANHAEFNVVPKHLCVKLPEGVSNEDASFVTLGAIALQGLRQAEPTLGERFVVLGLGLIGQLTVQLLKANGCHVLGYDPDPGKAELARELGADLAVTSSVEQAVRDFTGGVGADGVIVAASSKSSEPMHTAAEIARLKGRVVVVGQVGMDLVREPFYRKELDLRLSMSYGPGRYDPAYEDEGHDYPIGYVRWTEERNLAAFLDLVRTSKVTPAALVSHRFPIAAAREAYALLESEKPCLGVLLAYPVDAPLSRRVALVSVRRSPVRGQCRVGVIGAGNFAKGVLIPALRKHPNVTLGAVVTSGGISARHAAAKFGFSSAATDAAAVLDDLETQAVVIATRHSSHARLARMALEAGKHVFCEKPLALTRDELDAVISAAQTSPGLLTVGFNRRCAPYVREIKETIAARAGPLMMSYRVNAGAVPATSWLVGPEGGGRVLGEVCHFVDTMSFLAGAPVARVSARRLETSADSVAATLTFADGSIGTILYTAVGDPSFPKERLEVFAADRVAVLDDFRALTLSVAGKRRRRRALSRDKGHRALLAAFIAAARGEGPLPMSLGEIANVTAATFAIEEALRTRAETVVD
jgi:polar amino acid transport system substrate-binding protein